MKKKSNEERLEELESWKLERSTAIKVWAAFWGGICMCATTMGGLIAERWDEIKHFFQGLK